MPMYRSTIALVRKVAGGRGGERVRDLATMGVAGLGVPEQDYKGNWIDGLSTKQRKLYTKDINMTFSP